MFQFRNYVGLCFLIPICSFVCLMCALAGVCKYNNHRGLIRETYMAHILYILYYNTTIRRQTFTK